MTNRNGSGHRLIHTAARGIGWLAVVAFGLATLVGSGGGALGFPPCTADWCNTPAPPPEPTLTVRPGRATAQVGGSVRFVLQWADFGSSPTIQWSRSTDGGRTFTALPGATSATLEIGPVNLTDDGRVFQAVASAGAVSRTATVKLAVSSMPGVAYSDGSFQPADWSHWPIAGPNPLTPAHQAAQWASGGNPGAFRQMVFTIPPGAGSGYVGYLRAGAEYDPRQQGPVKVIDYRDDCAMQPPSETAAVESQMLLVQDGRSYVPAERSPGICAQADWATVTLTNGLSAQDFRLFSGPACPSGSACPDFSVLGGPMRFGYLRLALTNPGQTIAHGIDNWSVTVWRP